MIQRLKVIKGLDQYSKYCELHEKLMIKENSKDQDLIELLELLIENYDSKIKRNRKFKPVELLRELINENWESQSDFADEIELSPQLINDILNYRRPFSKKTAERLSKFFALKKDVFLYPYDIESERQILSESKLESQKHELEKIQGIGPKIAIILDKAGISTIDRLAKVKEPTIRSILEKANPSYSRYKPKSWVKQSKVFVKKQSRSAVR